VTEQELNLFEFASSTVAEPSVGEDHAVPGDPIRADDWDGHHLDLLLQIKRRDCPLFFQETGFVLSAEEVASCYTSPILEVSHRMPVNQTLADYIPAAHDSERGTGVFLKVGVSNSTIISFKDDITYAECVSNGQTLDYEAFKWIPQRVASYSLIINSRCTTPGARCSSGYCAGHGCLCSSTLSQCVDSSGNQLVSAIEEEAVISK
jgi:hypothetical protein